MNTKLATDKQLNYLTRLTKDWNMLASKTGNRLIERNWWHERSLGMTIADASAKIDAFRDGIFMMRFQNTLCCGTLLRK
jgi:hypothetical protein